MRRVTVGPFPALINYIAYDVRPHPVRIGLIRAGCGQLALEAMRRNPTHFALTAFEHRRWRRGWPFWTRYHSPVVTPAIISDALPGADHETKLLKLPGYTWFDSSISCSGWFYYLDDSLQRPLLLASLFEHPLTSVLNDFFLESSRVAISIEHEEATQ